MATTSKESVNTNADSCGKNILDLSIDSIVLCASSLCIKELVNVAMTCKQLRDAVYVDSIWEHQCRKRWPQKLVFGGVFQFCGGRKAYLERHTASQKFQFLDPVDWHIMQSSARANHILMEEDSITVAQGSSIIMYDMEAQKANFVSTGHCAQITCVRSVPSAGLLSSRSSDGAGSLLVTSSMDHTIRIWRKDCLLRTFRGHSGPVTTLANSLLGGQCGMPTLASGGIDGTIRLWALSSGQKRGSSPLQKTFYGHELAVKQLAVTEYNPSLLVSTGKDLKVRVWDVTSASGTGALVGSTKGPGVPVGLVCKESMCYVAGGPSVMLVDLRSMQTFATIAAHKCGILNFSIPISGEAICTGGAENTAKLWDLRNVQEPYANLGGHTGDVNFEYMDHYKAVTGGLTDGKVYVWDTETGDQLSSLDNFSNSGVTAMTVKGTRIATGISGGCIQYRDFSNCAVPIMENENASNNDVEQASKFWETGFHGIG